VSFLSCVEELYNSALSGYDSILQCKQTPFDKVDVQCLAVRWVCFFVKSDRGKVTSILEYSIFLMTCPYPPFVGTVLYFVVPGTAQSVSTISVFILLSMPHESYLL
jgi:hypothetical protein